MQRRIQSRIFPMRKTPLRCGWLAVLAAFAGSAAGPAMTCRGAQQPQEAGASETVAVVRVAADGTAEHRTIQSAIDAAPAHAVVRIAPGLYEGPVRITKPLTLEGASWQQTKLTADWYDLTDRDRIAPERRKRYDDLIDTVKSSDGQRYGEALRELWEEFGPKPTVTVSGARGVVLKGLRISLVGDVRKGGYMSAPMLLVEDCGVELSGCALAGSPVEGIHVKGKSEAAIHHCLVAGIRGSGIVVEPSPGARVRVAECDVRHCGYAGVLIKGNGTVVENCRISQIEFHGVRYDDASPELTGNAIFEIRRGGIYADGNTEAVVRGNVFVGCSLSLRGDNRDTIESNTLAYVAHEGAIWTDEAGIFVGEGAGPTIRRNVVAGYRHAVVFAPGQFKAASLKENLFDTTGAPIVQRSQADSQDFEEVRLPEGNQRVRIRFADPAKRDFAVVQPETAAEGKAGARRLAEFASPWPELPEEKELLAKVRQVEGESR